MAKMRISKNIRQGNLCVWKGGKLIRSSRRNKNFAGVWTIAGTRIIIDENFERHEIKNPSGLQVFGSAEIAFVRGNG